MKHIETVGEWGRLSVLVLLKPSSWGNWPQTWFACNAEEKYLALVGITPQFLSFPAHSLLLYYLGYPSSQHMSNNWFITGHFGNHLHNSAMLPFGGCSVGTCCNWYRWTLYICRHNFLFPHLTVLARAPQFIMKHTWRLSSCIQEFLLKSCSYTHVWNEVMPLA